MRGIRKATLPLCIPSPANEKYTPAHLRDPILSGQQFGTVYRVASAIERSSEFCQHCAPLKRGETRYVLNHDYLGLQLFGNAHELPEQSVARIPKLALTDDTEALTRRPPDQQIQFTIAQPGFLFDVCT